jgi:hypothetical protein
LASAIKVEDKGGIADNAANGPDVTFICASVCMKFIDARA